jgi:hypothetical protein
MRGTVRPEELSAHRVVVESDNQMPLSNNRSAAFRSARPRIMTTARFYCGLSASALIVFAARMI